MAGNLITRYGLTRFAVAGRMIDVDGLAIEHAGRRSRVPPRVMALMAELALARGATLTRNELLDRIWGAATNTPDVLNYAIADLRRALGDDAKSPVVIETVPRLGYRLIASVDALPAPAPATASATGSAAATATRADRPILPWALGASIAIAAIAGLVLTSWQPQRSLPRAAPTVQVRYLTSQLGSEHMPAIAYDGSLIAYGVPAPDGSGVQLMVQAVDGGAPQLVSAPDEGVIAFPGWGATSAQLLYVRQNAAATEIALRAFPTGPARVLARCSAVIACVFDWDHTSDRVVRLLNDTAPERWGQVAALRAITPAGVSESESLPTTPADEFDFDPRLSPDGRWLALRRGLMPYTDIVLIERSSGDTHFATRLGAAIISFDWLRDSRHIVFSSDHTGALGLHVVCAGERTCDPRPLGIHDSGRLRASRGSDMVVFEKRRWQAQLHRLRLDTPAMAAEPLFASTGADRDPQISHDGRSVAFVSNRGGDNGLWVGGLDGGDLRQVAAGGGAVLRFPRWHASGDRIAYLRARSGAVEVIELSLPGGVERRIELPHREVRRVAYAGAALVYSARTEGGWQLFLAEPGDPRAGVRQLTHDGGIDPEYDHATATLFYQRPTAEGVQAMRLDAPSARQIAVPLQPWRSSNWERVDGGFAFLNFAANGDTLVIADDTGAALRTIRLPGNLVWQAGYDGIAVRRDLETAIIATLPVVETDIGSFVLSTETANAILFDQ
jgi:DNA-binding winged helix-turn-helix (wHTH) protein/Tol biopolymer transport system component